MATMEFVHAYWGYAVDRIARRGGNFAVELITFAVAACNKFLDIV